MSGQSLLPSGMPVEDADIVRVILDRVAAVAPDMDRQVLAAIELQVRAEYGGQRVRIPKRKGHLPPEQRQALVRDAMAGKSDEELASTYGVHRATLYRAVKRSVIGRGGVK